MLDQIKKYYVYQIKHPWAELGLWAASVDSALTINIFTL